MGDSSTLLIFVAIFVIFGLLAALVGMALYFLQSYLSPEPTFMQKRLTKMKDQHNEELSELDGSKEKRLGEMFKDKTYGNAALGRILERYSFTGSLKKSLLQAGLSMPVDKFISYFMALPFALGFLAFLVTQNFIPLLVALGVPALSVFALNFRKNQRLTLFTKQLPEGLSLVTSSLRAGHSFQAAISVVGQEMKAPIGSEFSMMVSDINLGIPIKEAMGRLVESVDLPDVRMLTTAVLIQREAGGNLAEVLDKLGYTIRERFKLKGQIAALTGQSRMTGYVLGGAPAFLFGFLSLFMPDYVAPLLETELGNMMLMGAGLMQCIGFFIMKKVIEIRV